MPFYRLLIIYFKSVWKSIFLNYFLNQKKNWESVFAHFKKITGTNFFNTLRVSRRRKNKEHEREIKVDFIYLKMLSLSQNRSTK